MADYVYLLETRLSVPQQAALSAVRDVARQRGLTVFLVGGAVRDLISGSPVRDLDFAVQGDALPLLEELQAQGGSYSGRTEERQALYLRFAGGVRVEVGSTLSVSYPQPGRPSYAPTSILEDLRRRDFTANAMALSLNEGSYGLLMDPLNGVADIENRELRLVSNYGFLEDPVRMVRAARLMARLGWQLDERTRARYETGRTEDYIAALQEAERGYELEEIFHEEDPLRVMRRLEEEGWLSKLSPALAVAKANTGELGKLRESQMQLQTQGVLADAAAANFPLLTAKLSARESAELKAKFPRVGFVEEIDSLESQAKEFGARLVSKELAAPSAAYKAILAAHPAAVLWLAYSTRSSTIQGRFKSFLNEWPQAQTRIPYLLMTEMRITPELPGYAALLEDVVFAIMDGRVDSPEAMRAFLEPHSPPAPPPPVSLRRPRAPRKESKSAKSRKKQQTADEGSEGSTESPAAEASAAQAPPDLPPSKPTETVALKQPSVAAAAAVEKPKSPSATKPSVKAEPKPAAKMAGKAAPKPPSKAAEPVKAAPARTPAKTAAKPVPRRPEPPVAKKTAGQKAAAKPAVAAKSPARSAGAKAGKPASKVTAKANQSKAVKVAPKKGTAKPAKKVVAKAPAARRLAPKKPVGKKPAKTATARR